MPITLIPFDHKPLCYGYSWTIDDEDNLAEQIAYIAIGQWLHVQKILAAANLVSKTPTANAANSAIKLLTANNEKDAEHRDGWMFQAISWIAAHKASPDGVIRSPQIIRAQKGFDGFQLKLDDAKNVVAAIIFEDKATGNPRDTVRDLVWPEFSKFESGDRENEVAAEITALLQTRSDIDPDAAIENIIWKEVRHYRISITVGNTHANDAGRQRLFKDYDTTITGIDEKRRGETIHINNLRDWMECLAQKAITSIQNKVAPNV